MSKFAERLHGLRTQSEKTQQVLASELGISNQALSGYERGREPSYDLLLRIAKLFNVSTDYLLGNSEYMNSKEEAREMQVEPLSINASIDKRSKEIIYDHYNQLRKCIDNYLTGSTHVGALPFDMSRFAFLAATKYSAGEKKPYCYTASRVSTTVSQYALLRAQIANLLLTTGFVPEDKRNEDDFKNHMKYYDEIIRKDVHELNNEGFHDIPGIDTTDIIKLIEENLPKADPLQ